MRFYTGDAVFDTVLAIGLALAPITLIASLFVKAPYGRFASSSLAIGPRLGWFLMELPATVSFGLAYLGGPRRFETVPLVLAGIWTLHYLNRGFLFPLLLRAPKGARGSFGALVLISGWVVTAMHGYLHGTFFSRLGAHLGPSWLGDPRFVLGVIVYAAGLALNVHSDAVLRNLRSHDEVARGEKVYRIPRGGGFALVSSPSYLGGLVMWSGFVLFTWSLPSVFILAISAANLVPRALDSHRWYRETFPDYPKERWALVPFVL